jgi:ferrous iron transport protein A
MPCVFPLLAIITFKCYYEALAMMNTPTIALGDAHVGFRGRILALDMSRAEGAGLPGPELERRLIELGFVEGASVELLHQGLFGRDPIAVRVAATTIALRRREAMAVVVSEATP